MTWFILLLTNFLFLLLFARTLVRTDDREWIFNPHLLWAGHITDRIGRVATDIFPGLHIRGGVFVALLFLLAFRGALMAASPHTDWAISVGSTFFFHPHTGWPYAIAFSILHFAAFLVHVWGLALLTRLLGDAATVNTRASRMLDALAAPLSRGPVWVRALAILAANFLLAMALRHFAGAGIRSARTDFTSLFNVGTPARLAGAYAGLALLAVADVLDFARLALIFAIFATLFCAILQKRSLAIVSMEFQNLFLGRFSHRHLSVGMFDFTPILFFIAINYLYGFSVFFVTLLLRHFGVLAAGALAAQSY